MRGFFDAVSLLTRVPTRAGADAARAVAWMPVVGALVGLAVAGVYAGVVQVASPLVAGAIAIPAGVLLTGALHEDGLADAADAFGAGADRARTLEILKDPRHGTYGVLALVASLVIRVAAVAALDVRAALVALPVAHALARAGAVGLVASLPPAAHGLGASYGANRWHASAAFVSAAAIAVVAGWWAIPSAGVALLAAAVVGRLAARKIGGITGDVLGMGEQLAEIGILVLAASIAPGGLARG